MEEPSSTPFVVILLLGAFLVALFLLICCIRYSCPFWISEKVGALRARIFRSEGSIPFTKSPSLFSFNRGQVRSGHGTKPNIPIVIVSDENGKRVMGGKELTTVYQKQDLEEIL